MILSGADVFRINFSHADYGEVKKRIKMIRELGEELGTSTAILADLVYKKEKEKAQLAYDTAELYTLLEIQ